MSDQDWTPVNIGHGTTTATQRAQAAPVASSGNARKLGKLADRTDAGGPPPTMALELRHQIQQARLAKKLSQKELANKIHEAVSVVVECEAGKSVPRREALNKLSRVLGIRIKTPKAAAGQGEQS